MHDLAIEETSHTHIETLKSWFPDKTSVRIWGGPLFRHPFTTKTFLEDMRWGSMPSYSGLDERRQLLAFGQYYEKAGFCHLARLAVDPQFRSRGIGSHFISELMNIGRNEFGLEGCSLFVMTANAAALACYKKLGFTHQPWPDPIEGITYMTTG